MQKTGKTEADRAEASGMREAEDAALIEGRNAVVEALRAQTQVLQIYLLDGCHDGPLETIRREAKKHGVAVRYVDRQRLDRLSPTGRHQGVIARTAAYAYATPEAMLERAQEKGEPPFLVLLDGIEDPQNLGAIIRTAHAAGAHGVIIPKNRAAQLTAAVARASAGALSHMPVAQTVNLSRTIEQLKTRGLWFVCADMGGAAMYTLDLTGPIGLVVGSEGSGVSRLVREHRDLAASVPMRGEIASLNASVAAGVLAYEIVRQRTGAL